ncbi:MAG: signal peptidase II [Paracoccaceae bacterium]
MRIASITALAIFALDQVSKLAVVQGLNLIERGVIEVLPPFLVFRMAWNRGINFGLLANDADLVRWGLILISLAISAWVWVWVRRENPGLWTQISAGLLVGGAMGNVIDRVVYGAVADFLNMSCCGIENPYAFNVADIAIFVGAAGLVVFSEGGKDKPTPRKTGRKTP